MPGSSAASGHRKSGPAKAFPRDTSADIAPSCAACSLPLLRKCKQLIVFGLRGLRATSSGPNDQLWDGVSLNRTAQTSRGQGCSARRPLRMAREQSIHEADFVHQKKTERDAD